VPGHRQPGLARADDGHIQRRPVASQLTPAAMFEREGVRRGHAINPADSASAFAPAKPPVDPAVGQSALSSAASGRVGARRSPIAA